MRRFKQLLQMDDAVAILNAGTNGVLSLVDAEGEPYGVPLSYVYDGEGHIYFHSAVSGHKMECIEAESRCVWWRRMILSPRNSRPISVA